MKKSFVDLFTDHANQVMARADVEARAFRHQYIGTEHILLALLAEGGGIGSDVLGALGIGAAQVRQEIENLVERGPESMAVGERPLTPRALEALEFARQEALFSCQGLIDSEHLLLGLLREPEGVAGVVLRNLGLSLEATREEVLKIRVLQMKIVERAVRPVRSTIARRMKMREELLAHLTEIYDEERAAGHDPLAATQAAERRFGNPSELARGLQASVPWIEQVEAKLDRWATQRPHESVLKFLVRASVHTFLLLLIVTGLCAALCIAKFGWSLSAWFAMRPFVAMQFLMPICMFLLAILYYQMRDTWYGIYGRHRSLRLCRLAAMFVAVVVLAGTGLVGFSGWSLEFVRTGLPFLSIIAIAGAAGALLVAHDNGPNEIRNAHWRKLDLES